MRKSRVLATVVITLLVEIAIAVAIFFAVAYGGLYNVAASQRHRRLTRQVLSTTMDHSVRRHAAGIVVSPVFNAPDLKDGVEHYRDMCEICHAAPGVKRSEISRGLDPDAPALWQSADDWTPAELYWIVKNGVKDTGMPAFGPTHSEKELWDIVAFVKLLPKTSPEQFKALEEEAGPPGAEHGEHRGNPSQSEGGAEGAGRPEGPDK